MLFLRTLAQAIGLVLASDQVRPHGGIRTSDHLLISFLAGIRTGSRRLTLYGGYNVPLEVNPFRAGLRIVDCGDIPVT